MTIKNIGKSIFLNLPDAPYHIANWESRERTIDILRMASKQIKRLIDLGSLVDQLSEYSIDDLNGATMVLDFAAETFSLFAHPIRDVRQILEKRKNTLETIILDYKQKEGFEKDFHYFSTGIKVLQKILDATEGMQEEDNNIREKVAEESGRENFQ